MAGDLYRARALGVGRRLGQGSARLQGFDAALLAGDAAQTAARLAPAWDANGNRGPSKAPLPKPMPQACCAPPLTGEAGVLARRIAFVVLGLRFCGGRTRRGAANRGRALRLRHRARPARRAAGRRRPDDRGRRAASGPTRNRTATRGSSRMTAWARRCCARHSVLSDPDRDPGDVTDALALLPGRRARRMSPGAPRSSLNPDRGVEHMSLAEAQRWIATFLDAQAAEQGAARNTGLAYGRDLRDAADWLDRHGTTLAAADRATLEAYLAHLDAQGPRACDPRPPPLGAQAALPPSPMTKAGAATIPRCRSRAPAAGAACPRPSAWMRSTPCSLPPKPMAASAGPTGFGNTCLMQVLYATGLRR